MSSCNDYTGCTCTGVCKGSRHYAKPGDIIVYDDSSQVNYKPITAEDTTNPKDLIGVKKARLGLVPPALRILAAPAMALGAAKYGPFNWREKEVRLSVYLEAIQRHLAAYEDRQDNDEESGATHLSHVAACLAIIADASAVGKLIDDRPIPGGAADLLKEQTIG